MSKGRQVVGLSMIVVTMLLLLLSCVVVQAAPIKLVYYSGPSGANAVLIKQAVKEFNKAQAKIQVEYMGGWDWTPQFMKVEAGFAAGTPPDVFDFHTTEAAVYGAKGILAPIDDLMTEAGLDLADFDPIILDACRYGGELYAIPMDIHPDALYYNVDMFQKAGLDPNAPPKTALEFIQYGEKISAKPDQYGVTLANGAGLCQHFWYILFKQYGGNLITPDFKKVLFNDDAGVKAAQFMYDLIYRYKVAPPLPGGPEAQFSMQRVAMLITGIWELTPEFGLIDKVNCRVAPIPEFGYEKADWAGAHTIGIVNTKDPTKMKAAAEFVKWMSDNGHIWTAGGMLAPRKKVRDSKEFKAFKHQKEREVFVRQAAYYKPYPVMPYAYVEIFPDSPEKPIPVALTDILFQKKDIKTALDKAVATCNKILARYYK